MVRFELIDADTISVEYHDEPVDIHVTNTYRQLRCFCGRFISNKTKRCSQEIKVYRYGSFAGWEHY